MTLCRKPVLDPRLAATSDVDGNMRVLKLTCAISLEVAAIALTADGHEGKVCNLNGSALLSGPKAAAIWSQMLDRTVRYGGHDMDAFESAMRHTRRPGRRSTFG